MSGPALVLVGAPTSGKTTVGRAVSAARGLAFRDTDADIEASTGRSVADLFVDDGEAAFRELEEAAVARALAEHDGVLALGGGAVLAAATRGLLAAHGQAGGCVVWLDVDLVTAAQRAGFSQARPLLAVNPRAVLRTLLEARAPLYAEVATATVPTGSRSRDDVLADVLAAMSERAPR